MRVIPVFPVIYQFQNQQRSPSSPRQNTSPKPSAISNSTSSFADMFHQILHTPKNN